MATSPPAPPFGRLLTAMVSPFDGSGKVDLDKAAELAVHLVERQDNDGIVVNGTTGESPTTTDQEKSDLIRVVLEAVGDRAHVIAGVGTFSTEHTAHLAQQAAAAGAHGLLVVTPYYSRPPQSALVRHFLAVADATDLPVMLYDIPHRSGVPIATETLIAVAEHPRIVAVKDAKCDLIGSARVIEQTELTYYSGDDAMTLPLLSVGGAGLVGTSTHFTGRVAKELIQAYLDGRVEDALALHRRLLPVFTGVFATQGCIMVKAGLQAQGLDAGGLRLPMVEATEDERATFTAQLSAAGLL